MIQPDISYSARNFAKSSFSDITKFRNAGFLRYGVKRIKSIFVDNMSNERKFEAFFICSSSSHFFNKVDLEQYLVETVWQLNTLQGSTKVHALVFVYQFLLCIFAKADLSFFVFLLALVKTFQSFNVFKNLIVRYFIAIIFLFVTFQNYHGKLKQKLCMSFILVYAS